MALKTTSVFTVHLNNLKLLKTTSSSFEPDVARWGNLTTKYENGIIQYQLLQLDFA